jgi:hypothetical protein
MIFISSYTIWWSIGVFFFPMEFFNLCAFVPKKKKEIYSMDSAPLNAKGEVLGGWATTDNSGLHC